MRAPAKVAAFVAVLAIVTGGGAVLGAAAGPIDVGGDDDHDVHAGTEAAAESTDAAEGSEAEELPGGLAVAQAGYRLDVASAALAAGEPAVFRFRVLDEGGVPVTRFDVEHEKRLHLVVVGRTLVDYVHVHPSMAADGEWTVELPALPAGSYRAFADFRPTGAEAVTLGVDLTVTGPTLAVDVPAPSHRASVDGYEVTLDGDARPGESELGFAVSLAGESVRTDPYLGAAGHLVAIRDGDLAYLHVHPLDSDGDEVRFAAEFPSAGTYRLFLDFAHGGEVRTAAFTVEVPDPAPVDSEPTAPQPNDDHESH
jgi:hypothetical protein